MAQRFLRSFVLLVALGVAAAATAESAEQPAIPMVQPIKTVRPPFTDAQHPQHSAPHIRPGIPLQPVVTYEPLDEVNANPLSTSAAHASTPTITTVMVVLGSVVAYTLLR